MRELTSVRIASTLMVYILMLLALMQIGGAMYGTFMHRGVAFLTTTLFLTMTGNLTMMVALCFVFVHRRLKEIEKKLDGQ